ncbi:RsmB/NOP family class I SAM-dependent RNA methyltransferase [Salininema proteolyticum]|uniref:RsmB/NOP family class I SAM-dependent RNA methyltransferase n=1 Tax=Salininema proteolyticum TaxID=1607685 RepID=A0ABV8U2H8_9ACTN
MNKTPQRSPEGGKKKKKQRRREEAAVKHRGNPRRVAYDTLRVVRTDEAYANLVLPKAIAAAHLHPRDARLATELAYGTLRAQGTLDRIIATASGRDLASLRPDLVDALRLGAYQLLYTRIGAYAAVSTTVSLVKGAVSPKVSGLANAVLRKVGAKDLDEWGAAIVPETASATERLAFRHSHPEWIIRQYERLLPPGELAEALEANNEAPGVHLAVRPGRLHVKDLAYQTKGRLGRWSPYAVHLPGGDPARVPAVAAGAAGVQDEGSQVAALALARVDVEGRDETWVDLCAGPGGKTALLGSVAAERGARVQAVEVAEHRAELVRDNTDGMPVEVHRADGREWGSAGMADRVLVDAPCSGLGALRRRPESRWRKGEADLPDLIELQKALLANAIRLTRVGGVIAYVTCSPLQAETEEVVDALRRDNPVSAIAPPEPVASMPGAARGDYAQLWPARHGTDAMFIALLRREQ